jgi:hypothetical protein
MQLSLLISCHELRMIGQSCDRRAGSMREQWICVTCGAGLLLIQTRRSEGWAEQHHAKDEIDSTHQGTELFPTEPRRLAI